MKKLYSLLIMLLFTGMTFGQEVLVNGNFETWTDTTTPEGWTHVENITQESTEILSGTYSAKHVGGTKDLGQTISGIIPGDTYNLTINYKVESGDSSDVRIWSKWKSGADYLTDYTAELQGPNNSYLPSNTGTWSSYTVSMIAPATATDFYFEVRTYSDAVAYWDDFSFEHVVATSPTLSITAPTPGQVFDPSVSSVDVTFAVQAFDVANGTGDGYIVYSIDGGANVDKFDTDPITFMGLSRASHTVNMELVDNSGASLSPAVTASVTFAVADYIEVADVAALRASTTDAYYNLTGEVFATAGELYTSGNMKGFVQDATGGMMAYIPDGTTTNIVNDGDGISGLKGKLVTDFTGVLKLELTEDFTMTGNNTPQTPEVVTVADFNANPVDYESELIKIEGGAITNQGSNTETAFVIGHNYDLTVGADVAILRASFYDLENVAIPTTSVDVVGIAGQYHGTAQIYPRDADDIIDASGAIAKNNIDGFNTYPNPVTNGQVFVSSDNNVEKQVIIYDLLGKVVLSTEANNNQAINVSQLKTGIYMMKVVEEGNVALHKLMIK